MSAGIFSFSCNVLIIGKVNFLLPDNNSDTRLLYPTYLQVRYGTGPRAPACI